jgi:hypothetical protein
MGDAEILEGGLVSGIGVVSFTARMAEILKLRAYPSLDLHVRVFPGEDHRTAKPLSLIWGLRTVWGSQASPRP